MSAPNSWKSKTLVSHTVGPDPSFTQKVKFKYEALSPVAVQVFAHISAKLCKAPCPPEMSSAQRTRAPCFHSPTTRLLLPAYPTERKLSASFLHIQPSEVWHLLLILGIREIRTCCFGSTHQPVFLVPIFGESLLGA